MLTHRESPDAHKVCKLLTLSNTGGAATGAAGFLHVTPLKALQPCMGCHTQADHSHSFDRSQVVEGRLFPRQDLLVHPQLLQRAPALGKAASGFLPYGTGLQQLELVRRSSEFLAEVLLGQEARDKKELQTCSESFAAFAARPASACRACRSLSAAARACRSHAGGSRAA